MSKKDYISDETLEKVNGGYIFDDRRYEWLGPEYRRGRSVSYEPVEGWEKRQIGGSIKLINEQGNTVEEFQDMDKVLAREKELGIKSGSINQGDLDYLRRKARFG